VRDLRAGVAGARSGPWCGGRRARCCTVFPCEGRLAQGESASFTPKRSLVRSQYRPPLLKAPDLQVRGLQRSPGLGMDASWEATCKRTLNIARSGRVSTAESPTGWRAKSPVICCRRVVRVGDVGGDVPEGDRLTGLSVSGQPQGHAGRVHPGRGACGCLVLDPRPGQQVHPRLRRGVQRRRYPHHPHPSPSAAGERDRPPLDRRWCSGPDPATSPR
jgi:hypothetical protein